MVSYLLKKPLFLKQHKTRLLKLKFQDKLLTLVYTTLMNSIIAYNTVPTESELSKALLEVMSANERFNQIEIDAAHDMVRDIYSRNVSDLTGVDITNMLVEEEAKELTEQMSSLRRRRAIKEYKGL